MGPYAFKRLTADDLALVRDWLGRPHVAEWWPVRGIDQFIGEADLLNRGHGSAFIRQFCDALFAWSVPAVTTDPDPVNGRAVRAYEKAGFRPIGPMDTPWGHVLPMQKDNAS